jgi:hypothetical protein
MGAELVKGGEAGELTCWFKGFRAGGIPLWIAG